MQKPRKPQKKEGGRRTALGYLSEDREEKSKVKGKKKGLEQKKLGIRKKTIPGKPQREKYSILPHKLSKSSKS